MKATEAPEKLYFGGADKGVLDIYYSGREFDDEIEYIRADAFIEKACEWFRRIDYDDSMLPFETTEEFIKGFKNYMKKIVSYD